MLKGEPEAIDEHNSIQSEYEMAKDAAFAETAHHARQLARKTIIQAQLTLVFVNTIHKADVRTHTLQVLPQLAKWQLKESDLGIAFFKRISNAKRLR
jgi:hypothetical protein